MFAICIESFPNMSIHVYDLYQLVEARACPYTLPTIVGKYKVHIQKFNSASCFIQIYSEWYVCVRACVCAKH